MVAPGWKLGFLALDSSVEMFSGALVPALPPAGTSGLPSSTERPPVPASNPLRREIGGLSRTIFELSIETTSSPRRWQWPTSATRWPDGGHDQVAANARRSG